MKEFRFNNDHSSTEVADIVDVLRQPRLWIPAEKDYPNYDAWLDKTEDLIISGKKRAMAAYMGQSAVGTVIYQRDPRQPSSLEIRNISVGDEARGRYVGSFLLRNAEIEAVHNDFPEIEEYVVDTKATNKDMIAFLKSHGYTVKKLLQISMV